MPCALPATGGRRPCKKAVFSGLLCATSPTIPRLPGQEIEIIIKLRDVKDCIYGRHTSDQESYYTGLSPTGLIKSLKLTTEMISLDEEEKQMLLSKKIDYIISKSFNLS